MDKTPNNLDTADSNLDLARRFIDALNANDGDAVREIYAPDARIWHNFEEGLQSVDLNIRTLGWMHRKLPKLNYDLVRLEPLPTGYLQQHVLRGETADGQTIELQACVIVTVENGRVTALEEYLDPAQVAVLQSS